MAMKKQELQELKYIMNKTRALKRSPCLFLGRAQATFEYAIILAIVVAALMSMRVYFKRGIQAGIKLCSDELGAQREGLFEVDLEHNIIPQASSQTYTQNSQRREVIEKGEKRNLTINESTTRIGSTYSKPFGLRQYVAADNQQQPDSGAEDDPPPADDEADEEESSGGWMEYCMGEGYSASVCSDPSVISCAAANNSSISCVYWYDDGYEDDEEWY